MNWELKNSVEQIYGLCDTMENTLSDGTNQVSLREALESDIICFLAYLSASDGTVSWQEANFVNEYFDQNLMPGDIVQLINQVDILSNEFANKPPQTLVLFAIADNVLRDNNISMAGQSLQVYLQFFLDLGKEFLACDNEVTDNEVQKLTNYLNMMMAYAEKEFFNKNQASANMSSMIQDEGAAGEIKIEESLEQLLAQLNSLIGLAGVKKDVTSLINLLQIISIPHCRHLPRT